MLKPGSYLEYIESLAVSLLNANGDADVKITDPSAPPSMAGFSVSPINARAEIAAQQAERRRKQAVRVVPS